MVFRVSKIWIYGNKCEKRKEKWCVSDCSLNDLRVWLNLREELASHLRDEIVFSSHQQRTSPAMGDERS